MEGATPSPCRGAAKLPRRAALAALAALALGLCPAARGEWEQITVHLTDGRTIEARLVAETGQSLTVLVGKSVFEIRRDEIARMEDKDGQPRPFRPAAKPPAPPPPDGPVRRTGRWSDAEERQAEALLDRYFAATDDAARRAILGEMEASRLSRTAAELEHMRRLGLSAPHMQKHVPVPWRKGTERGWYNLALPDGYTPAKAWPLVLALHGMPSDGDNLLSWYGGYFPRRGHIVLFPTTLYRSSFWPAPAEKRELLRLLTYICRCYRVDYRRIYCTGGSGGGIGTWHWLVTLPELFAGGISFSAAGTIFDGRLAKLKGVPFYVHHGTADYIPIASVRRAVEEARGYGADIEFYVSEGTGHTPPQKDWVRAFDWLVKLPPNRASPRHLLEGPEGSLPVGYSRCQPFAATADSAAIEKVAAANRGAAGAWRAPAAIAAGDLVAGMVAIARIVDPNCDEKPVRAEIRRLADAARARAGPDAKGADLLCALNDVLFQIEGFARDAADPADEKADCLAVHRVLKRRTGSVFVLTGIYCAAAGELGLPVRPVVSPYHAFARYDDGAERINVEMTEAGGHFDDLVYQDGYAVRIAPAGALKARGGAPLLAAQLACLVAAAMRAGAADTAAALAKPALALDATCYKAMLASAAVRRAAEREGEAVAMLQRLSRAWPGYADPLRLAGEAHLAAGNEAAAIDCWQAAIRAPIKPFGETAPFEAELWYRIAEIHAARWAKAKAAGGLAWVDHLNRCSAALLNCLRLNGAHQRARQLLLKIGGRIVR